VTLKRFLPVLIVLSSAFVLEQGYYGIQAVLRYSSNRHHTELSRKIRSFIAPMDAGIKARMARKEIGVIRSYRDDAFNLVTVSMSHIPENDKGRFSIIRLEGEQKQDAKLKNQGADLFTLERTRRATLSLYGSPSYFLKLIREFYGIVLFDEEQMAYYLVADIDALRAFSKE